MDQVAGAVQASKAWDDAARKETEKGREGGGGGRKRQGQTDVKIGEGTIFLLRLPYCHSFISFHTPSGIWVRMHPHTRTC